MDLNLVEDSNDYKAMQVQSLLLSLLVLLTVYQYSMSVPLHYSIGIASFTTSSALVQAWPLISLRWHSPSMFDPRIFARTHNINRRNCYA